MVVDFEHIKFFVDTALTTALIIITIILSVMIHKFQKKDSKTAKTMTCLTELFAEYKATMNKIPKALTESKKLKNYLSECINTNFADFNEVYYSDEYNNFRDVHYFFELLGTLIRVEEIDKFAVWHYFSFPIEYFMETKDIRQLITTNNCLPSYAENFCCLFLFYDKHKKKNDKPWIKNGERFFFTEDQVKEYSGGYSFSREAADDKRKSKKRNVVSRLFKRWGR